MDAKLSEALRLGGVLKATQVAVEYAEHLTVLDAGAVAVLYRLAEAIDAIDDDGLNPAGKLDNVSTPTYLKYAAALGLTVEGRRGAAAAATANPGGAPKNDTAARRARATQRRKLSAA